MKVNLETQGARWLSIFLDGVDVSRDTREADDEAGTVTLLKRNELGNRYLDAARGHPAVEVKHGAVRLAVRDDVPNEIRAAMVKKYPHLERRTTP